MSDLSGLFDVEPRTHSQPARPPRWGAATAAERGPVIATRDPATRNAIGTHAGSYSVYRALAIAARALQSSHRPDLTDTLPADLIGPHPQWASEDKIVSLDPWGHLVGEVFAAELARGIDIRPTIAVTRAHIDMPEVRAAITAGRLRPDGDIVKDNGLVRVMKAAIDPVWYLPGVAKRFGISETELREGLHEHAGGMYPELVTRPDLKVFLPPIGGSTIYCFGDPAKLGNRRHPLACRVHDECNGSDVFGSDICTCRPYLAHGVELCIEMAQAGGVGLVVYNRKEGRALGEVTKFLVYNARKRDRNGDTPANYFIHTEGVAGVRDMRFQELMPDVLHWLGITHIDRFASMSDMKLDALRDAGITVGESVALPDGLIPADARVEIEAKLAAGYRGGGAIQVDAPSIGRALDE
ncbi:MAG TPA: GTP cyclohydrolase II [Xanthobacteraceae bacterium]|nr:GTP cyclohydrolase II [Xanthobacteraceae bacterium]